MLLIAERSPQYGVDISEGGHWPYQLSIDECVSEALREAPLSQFIDGFYCAGCGVGFVPSSLVPAAG